MSEAPSLRKMALANAVGQAIKAEQLLYECAIHYNPPRIHVTAGDGAMGRLGQLRALLRELAPEVME